MIDLGKSLRCTMTHALRESAHRTLHTAVTIDGCSSVTGLLYVHLYSTLYESVSIMTESLLRSFPDELR
jgi:hypothetical protein